MTIPYFEALAFTRRYFGGNPAGVCLLPKEWMPDEEMQRIAAENNLAETGGKYALEKSEKLSGTLGLWPGYFLIDFRQFAMQS